MPADSLRKQVEILEIPHRASAEGWTAAGREDRAEGSSERVAWIPGSGLLRELAAGVHVFAPVLDALGVVHRSLPDHLFEQEVRDHLDLARLQRRRRIGQRLPVQVIYFAYSGTLQAQALALVAKKLKSSLAVEGELVEEGLATHGDQGDDMLLSLARSLTNRTETNAGSLEALFAGVRAVEGEVEAALRPEDIEPEEEVDQPMLVVARGPTPIEVPTGAMEGEQLRLL